jgi:hypothetical protein
VRIAKEVGTRRLLLSRLDWEKLFQSASPPGALPPKIAKLTLTREATRRRWERSRALRSGVTGLLAAIRVGV